MTHVGLLYVSLYTIATQLAFGKTNYALENIWSSSVSKKKKKIYGRPIIVFAWKQF